MRLREYMMSERVVNPNIGKYDRALELLKGKLMSIPWHSKIFSNGRYKHIEKVINSDELFKGKGIHIKVVDKTVGSGSAIAKVQWNKATGNVEKMEHEIEVRIPKIVVDDFIENGEWQFMKDLVHEILRHEMVHKGQHSRIEKWHSGDSNSSDGGMRAYLSDPMEIMAYATSVISQLEMAGIRDIVGFMKSPRPGVSKALDVYEREFGKGDAVYKRLVKNIVEYVRGE